ncbi:MAG: hypothetical protein K6F33_00450 [Bacteroidales bacterium]|nr:hypothetical protein [Bacteroidales bacterium]
MNKTLIILVVLQIAICITFPLFCHKAEYKRDDYIGVYYYKLVAEQDNLLDFIVLYQDSTYTHHASDGHYARGKWTYTKYKDMEAINFDEPIRCSKEYQASYPSTLYCSPYKLRFEIDLNVDYYRVDSVQAWRMGITPQNVIWDMGTREDNIFTQLHETSMCCANIGLYFFRIIMFCITARQSTD